MQVSIYVYLWHTTYGCLMPDNAYLVTIKANSKLWVDIHD